MIRKVAIAVYKKGDEHYATFIKNEEREPQPGYVFMVEGDVNIRDPGALLKRAEREARRRGIKYVKDLDNKLGLGRK